MDCSLADIPIAPWNLAPDRDIFRLINCKYFPCWSQIPFGSLVPNAQYPRHFVAPAMFAIPFARSLNIRAILTRPIYQKLMELAYQYLMPRKCNELHIVNWVVGNICCGWPCGKNQHTPHPAFPLSGLQLSPTGFTRIYDYPDAQYGPRAYLNWKMGNWYTNGKQRTSICDMGC